MVRPLCIEFAGALYHITSRGDRRKEIFHHDEDCRSFLNFFNVLADVVQGYNWICHAYCLMTNHLVVETVERKLSKGMRKLNGVYTQASIRRRQRVGHLCQGRFKGILVDKDEGRYLGRVETADFLGDAKFVKRAQRQAQIHGDALTVPKAQRWPLAPSCADFAARCSERNVAMDAAYAIGAYSYRETAAYFGVHLATVGRIVRAAMQQC